MVNKRHDDVDLTSLEPIFALQNIIHYLVVLTRVRGIHQVCMANESGQVRESRVVQLTVTAHHARYACHNTPQERMSIDLVLGSVIHVRCLLRPFVLLLAVKKTKAYSHRMDSIASNILIDDMFRAGLDTALLQTQNCLVSSFPGKEGICAKGFPIPSALGNTCHIHPGCQGDIDTFSFVFLTQKEATSTDELAVESGG